METDNERRTSGSSIKRYVVLFCAEFIGTAILIYIGCLGTALVRYNSIQPIVVATTFGLAVTAAIQAIGHISGPHLNPGVTLGCLILGRIDWKDMLVYWAGQYIGAFFGYGLMWVQMPATSKNLSPCALSVSYDLTPVKVFFLEYTISAILFLVIGGATDVQAEKYPDSMGLRLGFIVYGLVAATAELSGGCLNSARALPPAVFNNIYDAHWAFHIGPLLGQCTGAVIYRFIFDTTDKYSLNKKAN